MANIVLLHGFGVGRTVTGLFQKKRQTAGFEGFAEYIQSGNVKTFRWDNEVTLSFLEYCNLYKEYQLYLSEKKKATQKETLARFNQFLKREQPTTIICHSMGAYLLAEYCETFVLPQSVKNIIFIQADVPATVLQSHHAFAEQIKQKQRKISNYFCPWDSTLWSSALINHYLPLGLLPTKHPSVSHIFSPLLWPTFGHTHTIESVKFARKLLTQLTRTHEFMI